MDIRNQHRHISSLQRHWQTNALKDYQYNLQRAAEERKAGNYTLAKAYSKEAMWDMQWGNRRGRIAGRERRLGK